MNKWRKHFDELALKFGSSIKSNDYYDEEHFWSMHNIIMEFMNKNNVNIITDIGCGNGSFSVNYTQGRTVLGVDISGVMLHHAMEKGLQCIQSDALFLPLKNNFSDMTLCISAIQLFKEERDVNMFLEEIVRITKPNGIVVLATINAESLARKVLSLFKKDEGVNFERMFIVNELINKLSRLHVDITEIIFFYLPLQYYSTSKFPGIIHRLLSATFLIVGRKKS